MVRYRENVVHVHSVHVKRCQHNWAIQNFCLLWRYGRLHSLQTFQSKLRVTVSD